MGRCGTLLDSLLLSAHARSDGGAGALAREWRWRHALLSPPATCSSPSLPLWPMMEDASCRAGHLLLHRLTLARVGLAAPSCRGGRRIRAEGACADGGGHDAGSVGTRTTVGHDAGSGSGDGGGGAGSSGQAASWRCSLYLSPSLPLSDISFLLPVLFNRWRRCARWCWWW
jgi:hypothetical protein